MRIATWNLDHAYNSTRPIQHQLGKILDISPDIIVLTETAENIDLSAFSYSVAYPAHKNGYQKYCAAIWSKWPIKNIVHTTETMLAICADITTPFGNLAVYGTIIPYHGYKGEDGKSGLWEEHYKAITKQSQDWKNIISRYPDHSLIIAGDFNQTRDGSTNTYGTQQGRQLLSQVFEHLRIQCLTEENFGNTGKLQPDPKKQKPRNNIDHICVKSRTLSVSYVGAWDHFTDDSLYLSDHNGVYVDFNNN